MPIRGILQLDTFGRKRAMRNVLLLLFLTLVCWLAAFGFFTLCFRVYDMFNKPTYVASAWIKERHAYHGIAGSEIYRGEHYFYRNGERIKL
jgi:hypothetical protein